MSPPGAGLSGLPDMDLIDLVHDGDARAFEFLIARHGDAAFSLAYRMLHARGGAEEVVQDAFLKLWRTGGRSYDRARGPVRDWVLDAVYARALECVRGEPLGGQDSPPSLPVAG